MLAHADHEVLFYDHDQYLSQTVADFLSEGLQNDEAVVVAATTHHWDTIRARLTERSHVVPFLIQRGLLVFIDAELILNELMNKSDISAEMFQALLPPRLNALRAKSKGVRVFGEIVDVLVGRNNAKAALQLESLLHGLRDQQDFRLLCSYSMHNFSDPNQTATFDEICFVHGAIRPTENMLRQSQGLGDVRTEVKLEQRGLALEKATKRLDDQSKLASLGEISAGVAHELSNPLAVMNLAIEQLSISPAYDKQQAQLVSLIQRSTQKLSNIVHNIQLFSRQAPLIMEETDFGDVLNRAVDFVRDDFLAHGIRVHYQAPTGLLILGHGLALEQVILNLLNNARDAIFSRETKSEGIIRVVVNLSALNEIVVEVTDNGCGMDEDLCKKIFSPFFTTKGKEKGTGLGLFMSYGIVRQHQGHLACRSYPQVGTTFTLTLPPALRKVA